MTILDLLQADRLVLKKVANTNGGEYAGACPFCEGNDRFRVWPESGRYWCRQCNKAGDAIQYLRDSRRLSYQEACLFVGRDPGPRKEQVRTTPAQWVPKEATAPSELWQAKAKSFLDGAIDCLWSRQGESIRAWLKENKGLNDETIKKALGYNPVDIYEPRETWGLEKALKDDGKEKKLLVPAGLMIPLIKNEKVMRLRIRRAIPFNGDRYYMVPGSSLTPLIIGKDKGAFVVVESELDAILLSQETGDFVSTIAMGTATAKPDKETHEILKDTPIILISLDTDNAGVKASWKFWPEQYGKKARRWPTVNGKDASAARFNGLDLRTWIVAGLFGTEEKFERFCIQTVDGGLSDSEALIAIGL
jgi:DNA primase